MTHEPFMEQSGWSSRSAGLRAWQTLRVNWYLGFTYFGGPAVNFKMFHKKFAEDLNWIDDQTYRELFSICQALSGPASTKMLYCINLLHSGTLGAVLAFALWCLPGAIGMFILAICVSSIGDALPSPVYALLSGLNAATVGIIALAAVDLSEKAISDKLTRIIVFLCASAGLLYNALWFFPALLVAGGMLTAGFDRLWKDDAETCDEREPLLYPDTDSQIHAPVPKQGFRFSWRKGAATITLFLASFLLVMAIRGFVPGLPLLYRLFSNLYLAGTIIFGGGPVVIPLLREYIVAEGWVSPRDFLIGLAIIQAFPGPNFNFAVFLGGLTAGNHGIPIAVGSFLAFVGIFTPGMVLVHGTMGVWSAIRGKAWVQSVIRGINAGAVGFIYPAVYRIWQVGYMDRDFQSGRSLGEDPWWVIVAATAYVGGRYFDVPAALAIILGGLMGLFSFPHVTKTLLAQHFKSCHLHQEAFLNEHQ
ncbi:chromate transporter-domain-containing protein [Stachybotrys elegans]|uniref:Chromate transporter-domain-containing protein n=1 Tax=Stachybotrys elegans TaxID=80388 RepID=A0A8K0SQX7_9HYPO|nr:chromate transporter-domain-containing protein [Stachybotrys elegans]